MRPRSILRDVRRTLLTGLFVVAPFSLTFILVAWFVQILDAALAPVVALVGRPIPGLGFVVGLALLYVAGLIGSNIFGQHLLEIAEELLLKIPGFNWLYRTIKQVSEIFSPTAKHEFKGVVLVEYPRPECWSLGFVTSELTLEDGSSKTKALSVFIPTNHMYIGDFVVVPVERVKTTKLTQQEGIQIVLSAGAALPSTLKLSDAHKK